MSLVWMFEEFRNAKECIAALEKALIEKDRIISDLESQLHNRGPITFMDEFSRFAHLKDEVLTEQPFADGKIPESFFLTPAGDDR
mgnify:FL=1